MQDEVLAKFEWEGVFRHLPDAYLILSPQLVVLDANEAWVAVTSVRREEVVGRPLFDVFPDDGGEEGSPSSLARASLERVARGASSDVLELLRYPVRGPGERVEDRFWRTVNSPIRDAKGELVAIMHRTEDVTASVRLERYGRLLDLAPDAFVIVGEDARIELVNVQAESLFGYTRHELVGQPLEILIPERFRPSHAGHMARYLAAPVPRSMGSGLQLYGRRKDGSELPIEVSLSPQVSDAGRTFSAAIRDISERLSLEAAARVTASRLASAVESIPEPLALFDREDRLVLCNQAFRALLHESAPDGIVGKAYPDILERWMRDIAFESDEARARFRDERLAARLRDQTTTFDLRLIDGRSLRVTDRRTPEGGMVKTIWDLTEDERRAAELREARSTAEAASAAKSEFLSSMSHELRTPLNAILGFAQLLERDKREPLSARHKERVEQILRGGEHLLRLINDILDLSRIESGTVTLSLEPVDVNEVLEEVRSTLSPIAARQSIGLHVDLPDAEPPSVVADRTRFAQILMNFGSNAIKYNRPGGEVRFTVRLLEDGHLRLTVLDTGFGIPSDKQGSLFQPFQRAGQETGPIEGTGIGLVITKRLAELMGGRVGFRSTPGEGSEFWVDLRVDEGRPISMRGRAAVAAEASRAEAQRLVLYVEDNPANVVFMRDLMTTFEGVELLTVPTAELGVGLARARRPALVLMDINLPGMSGLDALRLLKADPQTADIPVVALTAAVTERDKVRGREAGFDRYLTKPIKVDEFIAAVDELLAAKIAP